MSRFGRSMLVIVVVGFGIRVAYVAAAKGGSCPVRIGSVVVGSYPGECARGDQLFYNGEANTVAGGDGFVEPNWAVLHPGEKAPPAADHPPLTVLVLTPVSWLADHPPVSWFDHDRLGAHVREHRYTMVVLGTTLIVLIGLLARRIARRRTAVFATGAIAADAVGLAAAAIAALTPNLWVNDGLVMSETVTNLTVVGALLLALALWERPTPWRAAALGGLTGLAALARAELIVFVPLLALAVAFTVRAAHRERLRLAGAALLTAVAVVAPWVGYNLARFRDTTFISTNDGFALAGSNCDPAYYGPAIGLTLITPPSPCVDERPPPGDQSQVEHYYRKRAFDYIERHKKRVPLVVLARVGRTWSLYRPLDMVSFNEGEGREPWVTRLGLVAYYPTVAAAVAGAAVLWRRRERRALWVLVVPAIAVTVGVAASYGQTRFRAAAEPSLAILAALGSVAIVTWWRRRRARADAAPAAAS